MFDHAEWAPLNWPAPSLLSQMKTEIENGCRMRSTARQGTTKMLCGVLLAMFCGTPAFTQQFSGADTPDNRAFTKELAEYSQLLALPGLSAAVIRDGKIIYRINLGYSNVQQKIAVSNDSLFALASVTKSFTGVMMMQYEREGRISFDDYLLKYPVDWKKYSPWTIDANTRLMHVLSMTSGGVPGETFSYDGGRFGVLLQSIFDKVDGRLAPESYSDQISARILDPLNMKSTLDGYPDKPNSLTSKVVKRYKLTAGKDGLIYTDVPYSSGDEYPGPAAGLFSTIDDLADYTNALDDNRLITEKEYDKMTAPRGERIPYGFGWMTQRYLGNKLNWAYGEGAFDAALFLRVPEKRLTFIFLSNSGIPSHAPRLYAGNVIRSPFALAFLRHFVLPNTSEAPAVDYSGNFNAIRMAFTSAGIQRSAIDYEELCNQALIRGYMRLNLNVHTIEPEQLIKLLYEVHPSSFDGGDIPLMCLFGIMDDSELRDAASRLIRSFDFSSDHRPEVLYPVGKYYIKIGDYADAAKYFRIFADQPGFVTDSAKIDACLVLGRYYLKQGLVEEGRDYIWRSAQLAHEAHYQDGYLTGILEELDKN